MECLECYKRTEFHHSNNIEHTHVISTNLLKNNVFKRVQIALRSGQYSYLRIQKRVCSRLF